ncbi:hypothetical protein A0J61_02245 [Choanephora cucurbitarum]|uniref:Uncharacterized protein n=1 Tax=Choanephora cucurbitarum TaxID=101091 RepID=A0A1C7NR07_9FUNG|nr:hypothetical protein A0J61_02245 [Choanephora cucurbitarum]
MKLFNVSLCPENQLIGVVVDNHVYPLSASDVTSSVLYTGQAPIANVGYRYACISKDKHVIVSQEDFIRMPVRGADRTLNEHYERSWNQKPLNSIPTTMAPLACIHRITSDLHIEGEIPTIHFFGNQSLIDLVHANQGDDVKIKVNMTYISPHVIKHFPKVTFAISGHSTRFFAKTSYKFKTPEGESLFGYQHLKLRSISTDKTFMRDSLAYSIAESIGLPSSGHSYVRVYINHQAVGLFGLAEMFKKPWVRNEMSFGNRNRHLGALYVADISGGRKMKPPRKGSPPPPPDDCYHSKPPSGDCPPDGQPPENCCHDGPPFGQGSFGPPGSKPDRTNHGRRSDLSYLGDDVHLYDAGYYKVKADSARGHANFTRLMELTQFISEQYNLTQIDNSVVPLWHRKIDMDSLLRMIALEIVISNSDGYLTMANNYILYDDYTTDRIVFSAQDFDLTMGSAIQNAMLLHNGNYTVFPGFLSRPVTASLMRIPKFKKELEDLIYKLVKELVNREVLTPRIESLKDFLLEDVIWDQGLPRLGSPAHRSGVDEDTTMDPKTVFLKAIYGPSNISRSMSLYDWIDYRSANLLNFLSKHGK